MKKIYLSGFIHFDIVSLLSWLNSNILSVCPDDVPKHPLICLLVYMSAFSTTVSQWKHNTISLMRTANLATFCLCLLLRHHKKTIYVWKPWKIHVLKQWLKLFLFDYWRVFSVQSYSFSLTTRLIKANLRSEYSFSS